MNIAVVLFSVVPVIVVAFLESLTLRTVPVFVGVFFVVFPPPLDAMPELLESRSTEYSLSRQQ